MKHRAGTWNLRKGKAAKRVPNLLRKYRLHWLAVQELNGQGPWLQRELNRLDREGKMRHGYSLITAEDGDSGVLVRDGVPWGSVVMHQMGRVKWERKKGRPGLHPERVAVSLRIGPHNGGYRVFPVHTPPRGGPQMWRRRLARERYLQRLETILTRAKDRSNLSGIVPVGDWNWKRTDPRIEKLVKSLGGGTVGNGVDWAMEVGNVVVSEYRRVMRWLLVSDHRARVFTVTTAETSRG